MTLEEFMETERGDFRRELNTAAIALWRTYCRADLENQKLLMPLLLSRTLIYAQAVEGWSAEDLIGLSMAFNR